MSSSSFAALTLTTIYLLASVVASSSSTPASDPTNLIEKVCSGNTPNPKLCTEFLESQPTVVSAENLYSLTVAIFKTGITNSSRTLKRVESLLKKEQRRTQRIQWNNVTTALQACRSAYILVVSSMKSALGEVKEKECETASYDVKIGATDYIQPCVESGVKDETVVRGNEVVVAYGMAAFDALNLLGDSCQNIH